MKIPDSIRIGGIDYDIISRPDLNNGVEVVYAHIDYEQSVISMNSNMGMGHQFECITLWHEILHGIREHAGIVIENEEEVVEVLSKGIYQVLQDNGKKLFDIKDGEVFD